MGTQVQQNVKGPLPPGSCARTQASFPAYLDGAISGVAMAAVSTHLRQCAGCAREFASWRQMDEALAVLGPARAPENLQSRLRSLAAAERTLGAHRSPLDRICGFLSESLAPLALRTAGGLAVALVLVGSLVRMFGPGLAVEANDDRMAHFVAPHYLYSQVPSQPIEAGSELPILIDAAIDTRGRVYDFTVLAGPHDPEATLRIQQNLLSSVFKPASLFGEPVIGHAMLIYTGVSVHS